MVRGPAAPGPEGGEAEETSAAEHLAVRAVERLLTVCGLIFRRGRPGAPSRLRGGPVTPGRIDSGWLDADRQVTGVWFLPMERAAYGHLGGSHPLTGDYRGRGALFEYFEKVPGLFTGCRALADDQDAGSEFWS
jgi:hypothetical protein